MPTEECPSATVAYRRRLMTKLFDIFAKFAKRINNNGQSMKEQTLSRKHLSNSTSELMAPKSLDHSNFIKYMETTTGKDCSAYDADLPNNLENWEVLSQIHHVPTADYNLVNSYKHRRRGTSMIRHRSMNDLSVTFPGISSAKRAEKLNSVLDLVMSQFLKKSNNDVLSRSIEDLIVETSVQVVLQSMYAVQEALVAQRKTVKSSNYLKAIYSTESSSSGSDYESRIIHNPKKDTLVTDLGVTNVASLTNNNIRSRPNITMRNIMSPSFRESSAFKYKSKSVKASLRPKNTSKKSDKVENDNKEYRHYLVSARRATAQIQSGPKADYENLSSNPYLNTENLSPIPEVIADSSTAKRSQTQKQRSQTTSSKIIVNKKPLVKCLNKEKIIGERESKKDPKVNLQVTKTASLSCKGQDNVCPSNTKVFNIKFEDAKLEHNPHLEVTPITHVFAGGDSIDKMSKSTVSTDTKDSLMDSSVPLNWQHQLPNFIVVSDPNITEAAYIKSKTTFGRDTGYSKQGKKNIETSNYHTIDADQLNSNNNSRPYFDWWKLFSNTQSSDLVLWNNEGPTCNNKSNLVHISTSTKMMMTNNSSNGRPDSPFETANTESSCTFPAVKAKFMKYCSVNCDSIMKVENNNNNEGCGIGKIYERVMSGSDVSSGGSSSSRLIMRLSEGDTYSCSDNNGGSVAVNCQKCVKNESSDHDSDHNDDDDKIFQKVVSVHNSKANILNLNNTVSSSQERLTYKESILDRRTDKLFNELHPRVHDSYTVAAEKIKQRQMIIEHSKDLRMVYCRNNFQKKNPKKFRKTIISDNLLKHTFASQQKIRLKNLK